MKKTLLILISILAVLFIALTLLDKSEYILEKRLFRMQREYKDIALDPAVVPARRFEGLAGQYKGIIKRYPESKYVPRMLMQIGRIYYLKEDYDKSRSVFRGVIERYTTDMQIKALAMQNLAKAYEREGLEDKAFEVYDELQREMPYSEIGISIPIYRAQYYLQRERLDEARLALDRAAVVYRELAASSATSTEKFHALRFLGAVHLAQSQWGRAVDVYSEALNIYGSSKGVSAPTIMQLIKTINTVSLNQLQDLNRPIAAYNDFITMYPKHSINQLLSEMILAMQGLKNQDQQIDKENNSE